MAGLRPAAEMKDSGIEWVGKIPSNKEVVRNKYYFHLTKGKIPSSQNSEGKGVPYIGASELDSNCCRNYTEDDTVPVCNKDDVLILWDGARAGLVGTGKNGAISSTVVKCVFANNVYPSFGYWYFKGFEHYFAEQVHGTTIPHMNTRYIEDIGFINWSIKEQQAIAAFLDGRCAKIDELIAETAAGIAEYKELKQAVIFEAVTQGLDKNVPLKDSGVEWIGDIPEGWIVKRFKYVATVNANLVSPEDYLDYRQIAPDCIEKDSGRLIKERTVSEAGVESWNQLFHKGQLVYSKIRPILNKIIIAPYDGLCSADMYPLDVIEDIAFVQKAMLSRYFVEQVGLITQDRVKMPKINKEELANILMAIPPRNEQIQIVEYLNSRMAEIDEVIDEKQTLIDDLKAYKKSLIYEVVTGKRRVG
ncbi:MAG: restriction endonuclease subunit S [bacterium]|nr:restriction endonuclease subunit S [bacterium]